MDCKEFVNADEIAKGISPFQPENAGIMAGRLMLDRIHYLLEKENNFAFETTLATRSYYRYIEKAKENGFLVVLIFLWLNSQDLAVKRVKTRVLEGGHNIPEDIIRRRYESGLKNFFNLYHPIVDDWMFIDNSRVPYKVIAEMLDTKIEVYNEKTWTNLKENYDGKK